MKLHCTNCREKRIVKFIGLTNYAYCQKCEKIIDTRESNAVRTLNSTYMVIFVIIGTISRHIFNTETQFGKFSISFTVAFISAILFWPLKNFLVSKLYDRDTKTL